MVAQPETWSADWAWGLPLIVLTVLAHGFGLVQIHLRLISGLAEHFKSRGSSVGFALVIAATILLVTILHAAEASAWASAYVALGALGDAHGAMLFSLNAMTTYGHDNLGLEPHWRLMGALEALNGVILFGLTTAFLFAILQRYWPLLERESDD